MNERTNQRINRRWVLAERPKGMIEARHFRLEEVPIPELEADGEILVRNLYLSMDPTQRGWLAYDTYLPAVAIGEVVRSGAVGLVEASRNPEFAVAISSKGSSAGKTTRASSRPARANPRSSFRASRFR